MKQKRKYTRYQLGMRIAVISAMLFLIIFSFALELVFAARFF